MLQQKKDAKSDPDIMYNLSAQEVLDVKAELAIKDMAAKKKILKDKLETCSLKNETFKNILFKCTQN